MRRNLSYRFICSAIDAHAVQHEENFCDRNDRGAAADHHIPGLLVGRRRTLARSAAAAGGNLMVNCKLQPER
jgi:hypothetical protein